MTTRQQRQEAARQAEASVRLSGNTISPEARRIMARWVRGELSAEEMVQKILKLYKPS